MSRATITIKRDLPDRARAVRWVNTAPFGTRIEFRAPKRTNDQNARMWALLTDVASQMEWAGKRRTTNDWKLLFLDLLGRESEVVPGLDGGLVSLGMSSSGLSKEEMSDLMVLIEKFGAEHGVKFGDDE
jgi:hypothetical protein